MASSVTFKQFCIKCEKGGGVASCGGCQQWFCTKHFSEHRQELATEMDHLSGEHDLLQQDFIENNDKHILLLNINQWERISIEKIQNAAEQARIHLRKYLDENKQQVKVSLHEVTNQLKSSRQSDDYTEIDLNKWIRKIKEIQQLLEKPPNIHITDEKNPESIIHLIRISTDKITENDINLNVISKNLCKRCGREFSLNDNHGGDCIHIGTWHAKYEDCSYLKCGFNLGIKASIGKQHWSCCYSFERESNICTQSQPHIPLQ